MKVNLREVPYELDDEGISWVEGTLAGMTADQKIGQLFCVPGSTMVLEQLDPLIKEIGIGGIMYRADMGERIQDVHRYLQDNSAIPLLIAANLEAGGNGIAVDGTDFGKPLQVAATNDEKMAYALGKIS